MKISLQVDTAVHEVDVDPAKPLLWVLREDLGMMQAKFGCGVGLCGACSLYVGDKVVRACSFPISKVADAPIRTITGLTDELGVALKEAWVKHDVPQCGYCQPGMIIGAHQLLSSPAPADEDVSFKELTNICRCGTYARVREALLDVRSQLKGGPS